MSRLILLGTLRMALICNFLTAYFLILYVLFRLSRRLLSRPTAAP